jgi:hypothetical protein
MYLSPAPLDEQRDSGRQPRVLGEVIIAFSNVAGVDQKRIAASIVSYANPKG